MAEPPESGAASFAERNREILAERAGWPAGTLEACRDLEHRHPGWHCWWSARPWRRDGDVPDGAAFGAAPHSRGLADSLYATTPDELRHLIEQAEKELREMYPWRYRSEPQDG